MPEIHSKSVNVGPTLFCAEVGGHKLFAEAPSNFGGTGMAPTPPQALVATRANCVGMVVSIACRAKGLDYAGMIVEVTADLDPTNHKVENFQATVHMPGEITEALRRTVEASHEMCSIGNTLCCANVVEVTLAE